MCLDLPPNFVKVTKISSISIVVKQALVYYVVYKYVNCCDKILIQYKYE